MAQHEYEYYVTGHYFKCIRCGDEVDYKSIGAARHGGGCPDNVVEAAPVTDLAAARWRKQADTGYTARSNTDFVAMLRVLIQDIENGTVKPVHVILVTGEERDDLLVRADVRQAGVLNFWGRMGLLDHAMETMRRADVRGVDDDR